MAFRVESPKVWKSGRSLKHPIFSLLVLSGLLGAGCRPKTVRVTIADPDSKRATEAAQEGDIAYNRKDNYAALIKYLESVRLNPNDENVLNRLGMAYLQLNLYDEAYRALQSAVELNPKLSFAWHNLGSIYFLKGNLKKAERYYKKALSLKPDEASFHVNLASLYIEKKRFDDVKIEWGKALALDPGALNKNSSVRLKIGGRTYPMQRFYYTACFFASRGNVELAIENLQAAFTSGFSDIKAIEKQPDFSPIKQDQRFVEFIKELSLQIKLRDKMGLPNK
jgi:tetratricopeptide (TPR) repeat protein